MGFPAYPNCRTTKTPDQNSSMQSSKVPQKWHHFFGKKWMFPKMGFSPQIIHFNKGFHYFHHPFWGKHPYFWKHPNIALLLFVGPPLDLIFFSSPSARRVRNRPWKVGGKWMGFHIASVGFELGSFRWHKASKHNLYIYNVMCVCICI